MAWSNPSTRSTSYSVTAANWNELVNDLLFLAEIGYTEFTSNVSTTATTVGTAVQVVSLGALTYTADPVLIEFFCPRFSVGVASTNIILRDGTTVIGTIATMASAQTSQGGVYLAREFTPTAASHTYNIAAWVASAATSTFFAGTGGAAGDGTTFLPGFIKAKYVPR